MGNNPDDFCGLYILTVISGQPEEPGIALSTLSTPLTTGRRARIAVSFFFAAISLMALGVTARHNALFKEKMHAIQEIEKLLSIPNLFPARQHWKKYLRFSTY